jgi:GAF domain-containing protein
MAEEFIKVSGPKKDQYEGLLPQVNGLLQGEPDLIANMANISAVLKEQFGWLWIGFYLVKQNQLVLGPFQGPVACTRINYNKGVCGTAWARQETILVPDVEAFPGHIACSSQSKSEIVVPVWAKNEIIAVLDIDSTALNDFDDVDKKYLEEIVSFLS